MNPRAIALLGATGSIGRQVVEIVEGFGDRFQLVSLAAGGDAAALLELGRRHPSATLALRSAPPGGAAPLNIGIGEEAIVAAATQANAQLVVMAIGGADSLRPTLAALEHGKDIALASKEAMVAAGELVTAAARSGGRRIIPIDSEHSAIWQCRWAEDPAAITSITLTGSGGPFRNTPLERLPSVSVEEALRHPTWRMGRKITIDSATMMNKALEVIELHHLFAVDYDAIKVLIHPQSVVHGMVELSDGTTRAILAAPDMRVPIATALSYPDRLPRAVPPLDLTSAGPLEFFPLDPVRYPAVGLGFEAGRRGQTYPAVLNAANEVAAGMFLDGGLAFDRIVPAVAQALEAHSPHPADSLEAVAEADAWARDHVSRRAVGA